MELRDMSELCDSSQRHLPSYINLSCAVSGYHLLNKYNTPLRQNIHHLDGSASTFLPFHSNINDSSVNSFSKDMSNIGMMPHSEDLFRRQMKKWEFWDSVNCEDAEEGPSVVESSPTKVEQNGEKSFIQQRIERLYGPGALGVGFRRSSALLEMQKENRNGNPNDSQLNNDESSTFPSVFRHLRPEFRYQLPVKIKSPVSFDSQTKKFYHNIQPKADTGQFVQNVLVNDENCRKISNERVRNIPIELENGDCVNGSKVVTPNLHSDSHGQIRSTSISPKDFSHLIKVSHEKTAPNVNISSDIATVENSIVDSLQLDNKDGVYFLKVVEKEEVLLNKEVNIIEKYLSSQSEILSEEIRGKLLSTIGKVKLLLSQKVKQFKGLCDKNVNRSSCEEFPTTNEDLAGFWDMVLIQIDSVKELIAEIHKLKENNWKEVEKISKVKNKPTSNKGKASAKKLPKPSGEMSSKNDSRKKAQEERRKAMREAMNAKRKEAQQNKADDSIEIFLAEKK